VRRQFWDAFRDVLTLRLPVLGRTVAPQALLPVIRLGPCRSSAATPALHPFAKAMSSETWLSSVKACDASPEERLR
jgi:hypothetical protein